MDLFPCTRHTIIVAFVLGASSTIINIVPSMTGGRTVFVVFFVRSDDAKTIFLKVPMQPHNILWFGLHHLLKLHYSRSTDLPFPLETPYISFLLYIKSPINAENTVADDVFLQMHQITDGQSTSIYQQ